ncbi:winged helix-turn-helix domain-containing tetratricopeptide repeat protein [Tropicimonas aquimaris]|uniref:Winged helix-turn-helix domain-containing tetratricopeptide repeat protein n=1 Tax=Tropicimonas aquimaris TaxID=914152 RepID=A0ABW3ISK3_9RHOB
MGDERLWKGGENVPITNKAFQLLRLLVEKPNRLVTKEEVFEAIWGDVYVTESLVREYVHDLRVALNDNPRTPRFIETVPRRGYRYLGGIELRNAGEDAPTFPASRLPSIVVCPFKNLSDTDRGGLLARGLTDDLVTDLARLPDLAVLSEQPTESDDTCYELDGSVQLSEQNVRVNLRLSQIGGPPIWSERYDRPIGDFLDLQEDLTARIASAIGGAAGPLSLSERRRLTRRPPANLETWELYRLAFDLEIVFRRDWTAKALRLAERAVEIDPAFARGWLVYGWVHWQIAMEGWCDEADRPSHRISSLDAYERAARLDPLDAVAQMELAAVNAVRDDMNAARCALERAIDLGRRQADVQISCANYVASILGQPDRATRMIDDALALLSKGSRMHNLSVLRVAVFAKEYERALDAATRAPDFLQTRLFKALAVFGSGHDPGPSAKAVLERSPGFSARAYLDDHPIRGAAATEDFLTLCRGAGLP